MRIEWRLTPSLRVATFDHLNRLGGEVLVETDCKTKLCVHGETSSTIRSWLLAEARARAEGREPPARDSVCDCQQTLGLQNNTRTRPPPPPESVYDLLCLSCTESIDIEGEGVAYRMGALDAYLAPSGSIFCEHGQPLRTRTHAKRPCLLKAPLKACHCQLKLPRRMPHLKLAKER